MPLGGMKVKAPKKEQSSAPAAVPDAPAKLSRTNTDWKAVITPTAFLSRSSTQKNVAAHASAPSSQARRMSFQADVSSEPQARPSVVRFDSAYGSDVASAESEGAVHDNFRIDSAPPSRSASILSTSAPCSTAQNEEEGDLDTFDDLTIQDTLSSTASQLSRESSIYSRDSASIYSSASSIYSSGASVYSMENDVQDVEGLAAIRRGSTVQHQRRAGAVAAIAARQQEAQDPASRERSSLAKKAAMFKNSKIKPNLPAFETTLPGWSMICRAAAASSDCYDSAALTRRGLYTPANSSKDIKAMIVDDQIIDGSCTIIVAIRGTQFKSLSDWSVNKAAAPVRPIGFLDDEKNEIHGGFMVVAKAMIAQVASQLKEHPAAFEKPSLLFTGHSAGGAVAAMLYSHMLCTAVKSELTALADLFPIINCITFGAPPLSLTPLPKPEHKPGVFLTIVNEGDPVTRLSDAAYVKSLVKLMTTSLPSDVTSTLAAPQVKLVRRSRGAGVVARQIIPTGPPTPWEELPLWPTPVGPLTNVGTVVLLRDKENGAATSSLVTAEDLKEAIFADLAQHTTRMYSRRVKDLAFSAMIGRSLA